MSNNKQTEAKQTETDLFMDTEPCWIAETNSLITAFYQCCDGTTFHSSDCPEVR